jgi:predicted transcriptional regulator
MEFELSPDLKKRVEIIAAQSSLSPAQIIADALENGHSLEWQERFQAHVRRGLSAAEGGDFATDEEVARVRSKYRAV